MEARRGSKTARDEVLGLRSRAPIAGQLEDCVQVLGKLNSSLEACRRGIDMWFNKEQPPRAKNQLRETLTLVDEAATRLKTWDQDLSASSRALDHTLRGSSRMRVQTVGLLEELHVVLLKGVETIPPRYWDLESEPDLLPLPDEDNLNPNGQESDEDADKCVEDVLDIIACLRDLQDSLQEPAEDWDLSDVPGEEAKAYHELMHVMFPHAPLYVKERLVASAAKRRRRLKVLDSGSRSHGLSDHLDLLDPRSAVNQGDRDNGSKRRFKRGFAASDAGDSIAVSNLESIFSAAQYTDVSGATSVDAFPEAFRVYLKPPKIPAELFKGRTCTCRFCGFQLPFLNYQEGGDEIRMSVSDWEQHVYQDLQPYVCTFEDCHQPQQGFRMRADWFRHETFAHRSQEVWRCGARSCQTEFTSQDDFQDHLATVHQDLVPYFDLDVLARDLKHLALPSTEGHCCVMCGVKLTEFHELKEHVGQHMELFALASMQIVDDTSSEDEVEAASPYQSEDEVNPILTDFIHRKVQSPNSDNRPYGPQPGRLFPGWDSTRGQMSSKTGHLVTTGVSDIDVASDSSLSHGDGGVENVDERIQTIRSQERQDRVQSFLDKELSTTQVPDRWTSELTSWFNMPIRNHDFVGRKDDLGKVHDILAMPGQLCILSGRGGVGKTASAAEYCFQYQQHYRYIFWVEAESAGSCAEKFAKIAAQLCDIDDTSKHSQSALIGMTQQHLVRTDLRWLLVFDNVEFISGLDPYLPRKLGKTQGSVLVTTRENDLPDRGVKRYTEVRLRELSETDSAQLLLQAMQQSSRLDAEADPQKHPDYKTAVEASRLVGRLPLAIGMIAGYVKASRDADLEMFLEMWEEQEERHGAQDAQNPRSQADGIDASIHTLWEIGISELPMTARNFLSVMSFLNPDAIYKDLLDADGQDVSLDFPYPRERIRYKRMIDELMGRKMISVKEVENGFEAYGIHRMLQQKILADMSIPEFVDAYHRVFQLVRHKFPHASETQQPNPDNWSNCGRYMPHVFSLHHIHKDIGYVKDSVELAGLFYDAGFHVWERDMSGAYDGVGFMTSALAILDKLGADANMKLRADIHSVMGEFYTGRGAKWRTESVTEFTKALAIRQKTYAANPGDKNADILLRNAMNELACCLMTQNKFEEAALAFEVCLKQYKLWGSEEEIPFEYQKYYCNYGLVQVWRGNYGEGIAFLRKSAELASMHSTKTWHYCMNSFSLGCALLQSGDVQGALETHLETLKARAELYGKHEAATIISSYAVGATYHQLEDPQSALEYISECIDCAKTASGLPEEAFGKMMHHLSVIQRELGLIEHAERSEVKAMAILKKFEDYVAPCVKETGDKMMMFDDLQALFEGRWTGTRLLSHMQGCETCREKAEAVVDYGGRLASPDLDG